VFSQVRGQNSRDTFAVANAMNAIKTHYFVILILKGMLDFSQLKINVNKLRPTERRYVNVTNIIFITHRVQYLADIINAVNQFFFQFGLSIQITLLM